MTVSRLYTTRRNAIVKALASIFASHLNGTGQYRSNINSSNIFTTMKFYDSIQEFPCICITASNESRDYQTAGYKDRYLDVRIMIFIKEDNPLEACETVLEDIETLIEDNGRLTYYDKDNNPKTTHDITVMGITTDEGTLDPISIGEMTIRVHY